MAATVTAASNAVTGAARATSTSSQGGSGQERPGTQQVLASDTADSQASAGTAPASAKAPASTPDTGSVGAAVKAALPAAGTRPGVG